MALSYMQLMSLFCMINGFSLF